MPGLEPVLNTLGHENACSSSISEKSVTVCMHNLHYSVYHNSLTSTGAIVLARALQHNKTLKELKWVVSWLKLQWELYRYTVGLGCTSFYWISCTRSRYNYVQYYVLHICVSFHFPIYTHTVLNGMRSSGEILGIREPLHWLIHACWRTSKHWSELLLGSTWPCNVYFCYSMCDPKKFNFVNLWWILILILPVSK